jgi:hypothetical protein
MVLDLLAVTAIPTAIGASEAVHQQHVLDDEAESDERQAPFYLDVYCDAKSKKRDEVHNTIVVLKDGKVCLVSRRQFNRTTDKVDASSVSGLKIPTRSNQSQGPMEQTHRTCSRGFITPFRKTTSLIDQHLLRPC